jgi:RimJ/RimL family protein N-acetyltransferase
MVFERDATPIGVVNFTSIDSEAGSSVWSFYIGDEEAPKGSASIMGFLALDHAFRKLGLQKVVGESFVSNEASVRYHQRLGFREVEGERRRVEKRGKSEEVVRFMMTARWWKDFRPSLKLSLFNEVDA